ncbi:WYL domain-containing protein, partial [Kineococcus glutinatus]|uniref:WYL domain-containing protein n=1 Tax=Kineococcus glutinatus TaxID=1070872 RepID=UPI0031EFEF8E
LALRRRARRTALDGQGFDLLELEVADVESTADEVATYGPDVVALEPGQLREAVLRRLRGVLAANAAPATGAAPAGGAA